MKNATEKPARALAFAEFERAAESLQEARQQSKTMSERAAKLDTEAQGLREAANKDLDRALLAYAVAHKRLRKATELLESWDTERAERLLKSSETMQKLEGTGT